MSKVLLVEDDTNLSEIYQARLEAEGYVVVAAPDGETALAIAAKEKPDLILSDVMMPKISGFEMLDILRNTEGLKETKVIMLTALGQAEDKGRAEKLGADRYLVKSQVTLEDIVTAAHELLNPEQVPAADTAIDNQVAPAADDQATATPAPEPVVQPVVAAPVQAAPAEPLQPTTPSTPAAPAPEPAAAPVLQPVAPQPQPVVAMPVAPPAPAAPTPVEAPAQPAAQEAASVQDKIDNFAATPAPAPQEVQPTAVQPAPATPTPEPVVAEPVQQPALPTEPVAPQPLDEGVVANAIDKLLAKTPPASAGQPAPAAPAAPATPVVDQTDDQDDDDKPHRKIIAPIPGPEKPTLQELVAKEEARDSVVPPTPQPPVGSITTGDSPQPPATPPPSSGLDPKTVAL